ncbi:MAG TPA: hypothetical protein VH165_24355, partial [Kofleriaceae bacterium]|nr:hypothetical protein [Kofleriaceae bacterium]
MSYSWDVGNVHFVQLNNYPTYTANWSTWDFGRALRDNLNITSAITWLRNDLQDARNRGKAIVLNWHDWRDDNKNVDSDDNPEIQAAINDFSVSAVFTGHWHGDYGRFASAGTRNIPVFISGSAHYGTFFVTRYTSDTMYVWLMQADPFNGGALNVICSDNSNAGQDLPGLDKTIRVSSLSSNLFDTSSSCPWKYPLLVPNLHYDVLPFDTRSNRLTQVTGNWQPGSYVAECNTGEAVTGLSPHAALCSYGDSANLYPHASCRALDFSAADNRSTSDSNFTNGDWDSGYVKGECGADEYVAGVSQD